MGELFPSITDPERQSRSVLVFISFLGAELSRELTISRPTTHCLGQMYFRDTLYMYGNAKEHAETYM
jgi:hypothetical protein